MTNDERKKIIERINALQSKANDASIGEAEALLFAKKASQLMTQYNLTLTDLDISEAEYQRHEDDSIYQGAVGNDFEICATAIGNLFNCKGFTAIRGKFGDRKKKRFAAFFGTEQDAKQAHFMLRMIRNAIEIELIKYHNTEDYKLERALGVHGRTLNSSFRKGCASRLAQRIDDMAQANAQEMHATERGTALVVAKDKKLNLEALKAGINPRTATSYARSESAMRAGESAANNVSLNKGVDSNRSSGGQLLIGR